MGSHPRSLNLIVNIQSVSSRNTKKKYQVMRFTSSVNIDFSKWTQVKMERENNMKEFRGTEEEIPKSVFATHLYYI
jgi:hypothetical protein